MSQAPGFAAEIRPLFTDEDINHMSVAFDLSSYDDVKDHAEEILDRVSRPGDGTGRMPPPPREHWSPEKIQLFRDWMDGGCQP